MRTYIANNSPPSHEVVEEGKLHNETWGHYPDDNPRRCTNHRAGSETSCCWGVCVGSQKPHPILCPRASHAMGGVLACCLQPGRLFLDGTHCSYRSTPHRALMSGVKRRLDYPVFEAFL